MARNEFMFLTSTLVPSSLLPAGRSETLASQRNCPDSMSPLLTPMYCRMARNRTTYSRASSALRRSGSDTISINGTPDRLKLTSELCASWMAPSWSSLPVSSSRWTRVMPQRHGSPLTSKSRWPRRLNGRSYCEVFTKSGRDHLQADRQAVCQPAGHRDRADISQVGRDRDDVVQVHRHRVLRLGAQRKGDRR